jgi:hypothetical protein
LDWDLDGAATVTMAGATAGTWELSGYHLVDATSSNDPIPRETGVTFIFLGPRARDGSLELPAASVDIELKTRLYNGRGTYECPGLQGLSSWDLDGHPKPAIGGHLKTGHRS